MSHDLPFIFESDAPGKALILREGLRLFAQKGLSATSIRDIAQATGLSNPALYKHFKTKEDLALVLFERLYRSHLMQLQREVGVENGFQGKFRAFLKNRLHACDGHLNAVVFVTDNLMTMWPHMPKDMTQQTILTQLRDILLIGRSEGHVEANADLSMQLALCVGLLENVARQLAFGGLPHPAFAQLDEVERLMRKALS
jgi:AcrR family transcriptional regulator